MNQPESQRTYALIVGIEKYDKGSSWDLKGAGTDALKFAEWLLKRDVPPENILLYVSELSEPDQLKDNESLQSLWQKKQRATRENIFQAITKVIPKKKDQGDLLYIFWGGHGITSRYKDRRLFYDDGEQNLNLGSLLESLKSDIFGNFNKQILIVDACANYYKKSLSKEEYPYGNPNKSCQQVTLLATREGYKTKNIDAENTGLFSKIVLSELNKQSKLLYPQEITEIITKVQDVFRQDYYNEPHPIYLWYVDTDGNEPPKSALTQSAKLLLERNFGRQQDFIEALHQFNYREEIGIFAQFLGSDAPIGAFLISGEEETGQSWLLNRLWRDEVRASISAVKYHLKVNKKWTIETIWEKVGGVLGVAPEPNVIVEKMYEYWQNSEPVALVLYPVEKLKRSVLQQLIEELWTPLANYAENVESEVPLLLFLVDTGNGNNSAIQALSAQPNYNSDCPNIPVVLNLKEQFFDEEINSWTNTHRETIKSLFREDYLSNNLDSVDDLETRASISLIQHFKREIKSYNAREDSTPEDVLKRICELCDHDLKESFTSKFVFMRT